MTYAIYKLNKEVIEEKDKMQFIYIIVNKIKERNKILFIDKK